MATVNGRKPSVLHLRTVTGKGGGPEKTLLTSPRFIDRYDLKLAYIRPASDPLYDLPQRAAKAGACLLDIPERGPVDLHTLRALAAEIRTSRPCLLHAHDYKTNVLAVVLGRWFRIPVLTTVHGYVTMGGRLNAYYKIDRWALRRMHHVVAVSGDLAQLVESLGIPASRFSLVENAIDCHEYRRREASSEAKQRLGIPPERCVIGAVGRLSGEKGFEHLIRAVDRLLGSGLDVELRIAGDGPDRIALQKLIAELGRDDRIHLLGHCEDTIDLYQGMDIFALSSLREGLPNVLLEAMATEVPVVATRIAGVPRLIEDGRHGLLVEPGNTEDLAAALQRLISDATQRRDLAQAAREKIEQHYSFEARMHKIAAIYDRMLENSY